MGGGGTVPWNTITSFPGMENTSVDKTWLSVQAECQKQQLKEWLLLANPKSDSHMQPNLFLPLTSHLK